MAHYRKWRNEERWVAMQGMHVSKEREQIQQKNYNEMKWLVSMQPMERTPLTSGNSTWSSFQFSEHVTTITTNFSCARNASTIRFNEPYKTVQIESYLFFFPHTKVSIWHEPAVISPSRKQPESSAVCPHTTLKSKSSVQTWEKQHQIISK